MALKSSQLTLFFAGCLLVISGCNDAPQSSAVNNLQPTPPVSSTGPDISAQSQAEGNTGWQVTGGAEDIISGDLEESGLLVQIPAGSFDQETALSIESPEVLPDVPHEEMSLLGALDVSAAHPVRLNQATTITFLVRDPANQEALEEGGIWIAYYNGSRWEYFPPDFVDLDAATVSFETYHFSLLGYGKIDIQERLDQYAHSQAISGFVQQNMVDEALNQLVSNTLDHLLKEQLRIEDDSIKAKVIASLVNDDAWADMAQQLRDGNVTDFVKTLNVFAGQKIVEPIDESFLASSLETLSGDSGVELTEAAAQAAAYLMEGQPQQAARILGEKIADQFLVTTLAKGAVEVIEYQVDTWKDAEIEAAYQAYKNGADGIFWGYNVEPQRFNDLYNQMRGIAVRLEQEAVQREIQRREEMQIRPASQEELNAVREKVKRDLENQFKGRFEQEQAIAQREQQVQALIARLQAANLLEKNRFSFDPAYDTLETRLDKLFHLAKKILRDTGRQDWTTGVSTTDKAISTADLVTLIQIWYSEGRDRYIEEIFKRYGIRLTPACRWEYAETKEYLSDSGGRFQVSFDGASQVTTSFEFQGNMGCSALTLNTTHSWSEPPAVLIPNDQLSFEAAVNWSLDGDRACSSLSTGLTTFINSTNLMVRASSGSIATWTTPEGSMSSSGDWVVPNGAPGNRLEINATADGGGAGGSVKYFYTYVCQDP